MLATPSAFYTLTKIRHVYEICIAHGTLHRVVRTFFNQQWFLGEDIRLIDLLVLSTTSMLPTVGHNSTTSYRPPVRRNRNVAQVAIVRIGRPVGGRTVLAHAINDSSSCRRVKSEPVRTEHGAQDNVVPPLVYIRVLSAARVKT